ncbi:MAG: 4'-phosphopantetheinyl transferase superfamily protein [Bacteroidetes bacterium]|nr:4'-phosphopantetheinyl transferase superfamily protein [Bacteroidota bacterium]
MPLKVRQFIAGKGELAIWHVTEKPQELLEILKLHGIYADVPFSRNPKRLSEWLAARVLLSELNIKQKIIYNEQGKPFLDGDGAFVSISHSGPFVAVIINHGNKVGIDIEITGSRIHRVSHKFVNDFENNWLSELHKTLQLYIIWGAKECAFKIFGLGAIDFRDHLTVEPFEFSHQGITQVHFKKEEIHCVYQVFFQYLDNLMITYAIAS